ncbi:glycoside hydrolase family 3 N-terminal domain-containing protein [Campylobacter gastrosuis]|uniref:beta-N-acetylhexosaminidase n=1 Tax=Campylobacter gastrosuis TaxID=2974576 RepID=A0ABT7HPK0_9BACT|nr:glycoside hydrolase family 3 N-terminal domain-containing protein [Campylobacter gastrosuis]MDL0088358.1 glycoside hydrolase family 3 protein [Campylobacter gastrosuis]
MRFLFFLLICLNLSAKEPNLREQIGQMIMVGFNGLSTNDVGVRAMLSDLGYSRFGGVMLLGRNITNKKSLINLTNEIKKRQKNVLIAIDEEGGYVSRLKDASFQANYASAYDVGVSFDINMATNLYAKMAKNLKECGINVNFAPVVDLHFKASPIIGAKKRAYSQNPQKVALYAEIFMNELEKQGVFSVLKHFPGQGEAKQDSHKDKTYANLTKEGLLPFSKLINRAKMVMVGHIFVQNLDEKNPATLSEIVINRLLRQKLGFNGVVISDDMLMRGVGDLPLKEQIIKFINAGGDILLFSEFKIGEKRTADVVYEAINEAINEKKISKERINQSYKRVLKLKEELK